MPTGIQTFPLNHQGSAGTGALYQPARTTGGDREVLDLITHTLKSEISEKVGAAYTQSRHLLLLHAIKDVMRDRVKFRLAVTTKAGVELWHHEAYNYMALLTPKTLAEISLVMGSEVV